MNTHPEASFWGNFQLRSNPVGQQQPSYFELLLVFFEWFCGLSLNTYVYMNFVKVLEYLLIY